MNISLECGFCLLIPVHWVHNFEMTRTFGETLKVIAKLQYFVATADFYSCRHLSVHGFQFYPIKHLCLPKLLASIVSLTYLARFFLSSASVSVQVVIIIMVFGDNIQHSPNDLLQVQQRYSFYKISYWYFNDCVQMCE